jgi:hypothetical protein
MKRFLGLLCLVLAIALPLHATSLTGTIKRPDGTSLTGKLRLTLSHPAHDKVAGTVVVPAPVTFNVTSGALPGAAAVVGNDSLEPTGTYYWAEYFTAGGSKIMSNAFYITGIAFDIGAATPTTVTTNNISYVPPLDAISSTDLSATTTGKGAQMVGFKQTGTGAIATTADAILKEFPTLKTQGAAGNGVTDDSTALSNACAAHTSVIVGPGTYKINTDTTISACQLVFLGGQLSPGTGKTLTIAAPASIDAQAFQIFTGAGIVTFTNYVGSVRPEWWASNTTPGTTDMTNAIKAAYAAWPKVALDGYYLVTDTITINQRFSEIGGSGNNKGTIKFNPVSAKILFDLTGCTYNSGYFGAKNDVIRNLILTSSNAVKKTGIHIDDGSEILIEGIQTDNVYWTSSTNDSIGIQTNGREFIYVKKCAIWAEYPIIIDNNTNFIAHTGLGPSIISADLFHFSDLNLVTGKSDGTSAGHYCITAANEASIYNSTFSQIFGGFGKGVFYLHNTASTGGNSLAVKFVDIRHEQGDADAISWVIYWFDTSYYTLGLTIENIHASFQVQGPYIVGVSGLTIKNLISLNNTGTQYTFAIDNVMAGTMENVIGRIGATYTFGFCFATDIQYSENASYRTWYKATIAPANETGWTAPTLSGAWALQETVGYRKNYDGEVRLKGAVKSGSGAIFTLPAGFRPPADKFFVVPGDTALAVVSVQTTGVVTLVTGAATSGLYLDSISFKIN